MSSTITPSADDLNIEQAATRVGVSARTIQRWIAEGRLPAYTLGARSVRIKVEDLHVVAAAVTPASSRAQA